MSEPTLSAPQETDLTHASVPAQPPTTPGPDDPASSVDRSAAQPPISIDSSHPVDPATYENAPFDSAQLAAFKQLADELHLGPEQVEKILAFETSRAEQDMQKAKEEKHQQSIAWANQTRALYGAGLEQEIVFALRAANAFGGPELRELLEKTGLGNHPVIIRTLSGIGRTISEDASLGGQPSAPQDKTFAEALYGKRN